MEKQELQVLKGTIHTADFQNWPAEASTNSIHEAVKAKALEAGGSLGYIPVPHWNPVEDQDWKIDVGWFDEDGPVVGIEVDGTWKEHSIRKLRYSGVNKRIIIAKTTNKSRLRKRMKDEHIPEDIHVVDAEIYAYDI
jgi:hypothetical protein